MASSRYSESLRHQGLKVPDPRRVGSGQRARLDNRLRAFLTAGGFPEVQGLDQRLRRRVLQDYVDVVILRDVIERHRLGRVIPLRQLTRQLLHAPAGLLSVNKLYRDFRSRGIAVSKNTLHELVDHLADACLFFLVPIHAASERARQVNPRKVYPIDTGLAHAVSTRPQPEWGHLLETFVFLTLRRAEPELSYYRTAKGREVDFLVTDESGARSLVQVCADMSAPETRTRELTALEEAMGELGLDRGTIVTLDEETTVTTEPGEVEVIPAWRWALTIQPPIQPERDAVAKKG